jgi:hypothetical protein
MLHFTLEPRRHQRRSVVIGLLLNCIWLIPGASNAAVASGSISLVAETDAVVAAPVDAVTSAGAETPVTVTQEAVTTAPVTKAATPQAFAPTPFRAVYKADYKGLPIRATGIRELKMIGPNNYLLSSTATSFFASISEQSAFTLTPENRVLPTEYQYHRKGLGKNRDAVLRFDWQANTVLNDVQAQPWTMDIPADALDKLSYQLQMRHELVAAHKQGLPWPQLTYEVADGGQLKSYSFEILGEETVKTPVGTFNALKITRVRQDSDRTTIFWLAPAYDFLLVRFLQQEEEGGGFELLLEEAQFDGAALKGNQGASD